MKYSFIATVLVASLFCISATAGIINVDFTQEVMDFDNYHNITNEFADQGLVFSSDASGLEGDYVGLAWQENIVLVNEFHNMFRLDFIYPQPVREVTVTFRDRNTYGQTHSLYAFDKRGALIDLDSFFDGGDGSFTNPDPFDLTVSAKGSGIASLIAYEQQFGAQRLMSISYRTVSEPGSIALFGIGLMGLIAARRRSA